MDILNFISWIKAGKYSPTMPADAITVVGVPNPTRGDAYLPVTIPVTAFADLFPVSNTNIGKLIGGGIVVAEWDENGVKKALIASLTDLGLLPWTVPAQVNNLIGPTAQSWSDGLGNTNAIIAQTGVAATTAYAAGIAKLYLGGGFTDWYLPAAWELNMCYNSASVVNKILGANGFQTNTWNYWSSTEITSNNAWRVTFKEGTGFPSAKSSGGGITSVRAVRIHTL
jgi:hypothetical protein